MCTSHHNFARQSTDKSGILQLKGHCLDDFAVFWSKQLKYLTKNLLLTEIALKTSGKNIKGFLQGRTNYNPFLATPLKYTRRT